MRRVVLWSWFLLVLLGVSTAAFAQRTTGSVVGIATDESGAVLPGVTVTLQGEGVPGQPTTVTGTDGAYRFPTVPPGDYTLTFSLPGFATVRQEKVPVPLGATVELN